MAFLVRTPRYVFIAFFVTSLLVSIYALRQNNITMVKLRDAVYVADEKGGDVNTALNELRQYVYAHMNTNLSSGGNSIKPPIQLKYTYDRLVAEGEKAVNDEGLYTEAANYCQKKIPASVSISGRGRVACVQEYILSRGGKAAPKIPTALYQFDFVSPTWSPDFAGFMTALSGLLLILLVTKLTIDKLFRPQASKSN